MKKIKLNPASHRIRDKKEIYEIQQGLEDLKKGRVYSIYLIAKELGVILK
ncbi:hypothetical protein J4467_02180 [Candidatus Woesearchaeota archaeon]|nr:hypothetical protein [Candidatus Woesearchaeota archaeon]